MAVSEELGDAFKRRYPPNHREQYDSVRRGEEWFQEDVVDVQYSTRATVLVSIWSRDQAGSDDLERSERSWERAAVWNRIWVVSDNRPGCRTRRMDDAERDAVRMQAWFVLCCTVQHSMYVCHLIII